MLGSASPRNPSVRIAARSSATRILLVACRSTASRASSGAMPSPSSSTRIEPLAAELDRDGDASRAGVERVLDELLDDRRRALDDLAGRDLVGELGRQALDAVHSQSSPPEHTRTSPPDDHAAMMPTIHQNCAPSPPGKSRQSHVHPEHPVSTVSGMKIVAITVSTFMT